MIRLFLVTVDLPKDVTIKQMRDYIEEAVGTWCRSLDPENNPLFDIDADSVKVRRVQSGDVLK